MEINLVATVTKNTCPTTDCITWNLLTYDVISPYASPAYSSLAATDLQ